MFFKTYLSLTHGLDSIYIKSEQNFSPRKQFNIHLVSNRYCLRLKPKHFDISLFNWHWQWHIICFVFTEDAEDGPLRANIVDVAVPSALLGITWILLIIYVVFQKWRRNLKTTHQHDEKVNQLETQSLEQHYDDLQDIGEENNYSHLSWPSWPRNSIRRNSL